MVPASHRGSPRLHSPIDLAATAAFDLGGSTVRPPSCEISNRLQTIRLEPGTTKNDEGRTIIMVTHEDDVAGHAKRIIRLRDGLLQSDRPNEKRIAARKHVQVPGAAFEPPIEAVVEPA